MAKERELLFSITKKDFTVQTFRAGGKGGQHQNKTNTGVRIIHAASGARNESRNSRSQADNKKSAFSKLMKNPTFLNWLKLETARQNLKHSLKNDDIEERVRLQMLPFNLNIEVAESFE